MRSHGIRPSLTGLSHLQNPLQVHPHCKEEHFLPFSDQGAPHRVPVPEPSSLTCRRPRLLPDPGCITTPRRTQGCIHSFKPVFRGSSPPFLNCPSPHEPLVLPPSPQSQPLVHPGPPWAPSAFRRLLSNHHLSLFTCCPPRQWELQEGRGCCQLGHYCVPRAQNSTWPIAGAQ